MSTKSKVNELRHDIDEHDNNKIVRDLLGEILAHDSLHRPKVLLEMMCHPEKNMNELWPVVGKIWCEARGDELDLSEWSNIWSIDGDRSLVMKKRECEHLTDMPEKFIVWQGGAFLKATHGLSWADDMETAYSDALRVATVGKPGIAVWGELEKSKVLAFFGRRGRSEFVAFPSEVRILGYKPVRVRAIDVYSRWEIPLASEG